MASKTSHAPAPVRSDVPIQRITRPFRRFARVEAGSGILLLMAAVAALVWANSPWSDAYTQLWSTPIGVSLGELELRKALLLWINDGLMAIFFLLVGLEIKRELSLGELRSPRRAALPAAAAVGGMVVPAVIYTTFHFGGPFARGWGVPMATDIAFALGILALVGSRVPVALKVFLTAVAIVDDLGAVMVIAVFYSSNIDVAALGAAAALFVALMAVGAAGTRSVSPYVILGSLLWLAMLLSGVHATVAGVLIAMAVPIHARRGPAAVSDAAEPLREAVHRDDVSGATQHLRAVELAAVEARSPLERAEDSLHPWTAYAILPLFALANAGVPLADLGTSITHPVASAVALALVVGNPIGIGGCTWLAVRSGLADLPRGVTWRHVAGAASLAGVGFTMSIFIGTLAFGDPELLAIAKVGILAGSLISGVIGFTILRTAPVQPSEDGEG